MGAAPRWTDPDTGRRAIQCHCGASRRHTIAQEAFAAGWWRTWGVGGRTYWHCPEHPPAGIGSSGAEGSRGPYQAPAPPVRFLEQAISTKGDDRIGVMWVLEQLERSDPERAALWRAHVVARLPCWGRIAEDWAGWLHLRNHWTDPMLAHHSNKSTEHYSPPLLCDRARTLMGGIDTDPASCPLANTLVRATRFYTEEDNGLALPWEGRVWLNPPGKRKGRESQQALWYATLSHRFEMGQVVEACFLCFNLELFRHAQAYAVRQPLDYSVVLFQRRIAYYERQGKRLVRGEDPPHPSALVYLGKRHERLRELFDTRLVGSEDPFAGYVFIRDE